MKFVNKKKRNNIWQTNHNLFRLIAVLKCAQRDKSNWSFKEVKVPIRGYRLPLTLPINSATTKTKTERNITEALKARKL